MEDQAIIGPAAPGEGEGIAQVHKATWLATYPNAAAGITEEDVLLMAKNFDNEEHIKNWEQTISVNGRGLNYICVAKVSGRVVAFCCGKKNANYNQLSALYILPGWQKRGIGARLAAEIIGWLGRAKPVLVNPVEYNRPAVAFYEKIGFIVIAGKRSQKEMPSGKNMPLIQMELPPLAP